MYLFDVLALSTHRTLVNDNLKPVTADLVEMTREGLEARMEVMLRHRTYMRHVQSNFVLGDGSAGHRYGDRTGKYERQIPAVH